LKGDKTHIKKPIVGLWFPCSWGGYDGYGDDVEKNPDRPDTIWKARLPKHLANRGNEFR